MLLRENVLFYVFILIESYFVVKSYGNSTAADVEEYMVRVYDMDKYMDYYDPQTRSTRNRPTPPPARTTRDTPTPARTTQETPPKPTDTTSPTEPTEPTQPSFKPIDYLVNITTEQINDFVTNMDLVNKTIVAQTKLIYGEDRPDKYRDVMFQLLDYFKSIAGPDWLPGLPKTHAGNSPQTEPPLEDYDMQPEHKHQTIPKEIQLQSPPMSFYDDDDENQTKLPLYSTLKPVTEDHKPLNRSALNKARHGALYNISTNSTIPHKTKPGHGHTQTPSVKLQDRKKTQTTSLKLHDRKQTQIPSNKLQNRKQTQIPSNKLHDRQKNTPSNKLHDQQQTQVPVKLNDRQQKTPSKKFNYQQQKTPSNKLHYQKPMTPSIKFLDKQQNTPSTKLHDRQQTQTPNILHVRQQTRSPIKLHDQQQKTPSNELHYQQQNTPSIKLHVRQQKTPSVKLHVRQQNATPSIPDHQEPQSLPPQVDVYDLLVTIEYPTDAGYYDLDAITGGKGYGTSIDDFNSTLGPITEPPPPTTVHYIIREVKTTMAKKDYGYMKGFVVGLCTIIASKDTDQAKVLYGAMRDVTLNMSNAGTFKNMGKRFGTAIIAMTLYLNTLNPTAVQGYAEIAVRALEVIEVLPLDIQNLLRSLDELYTVEEGEQLLASLVPIAEYPEGDNATVVAKNMMDKIFQPYFRAEGSPSAHTLLQLIDRVMESRNLGNRRLIKHPDDGFFHNNVFYKDGRGKDKNVKAKALFNELNDKERRKVIIKELIENVKALDGLKKYESETARFTTNKWRNFYKMDLPNYYHKRADLDQIKAKGNKNFDNLNKKFIQMEDRRDKMANSGDGTWNDRVSGAENAKTKNVKGSRKNKIHSGMDIDTDRLYGLTSESESESKSESKSEPKTHRHKIDKHMKHKIRHHLKHNHRKLYKKLRKLHDRNKMKMRKSKLLKKSKGQKRFNVVEEPQIQPPFQDKTRAEDGDTRNQHSNEENRRLSEDHRRPYRRQPDTKRRPPAAYRQPPGTYKRPPGVNRVPDINRRPSAAYRRPPGIYKRPGANRQSPVNIIRPPVANKRPPVANTRPPYEIIKPPYTTEPPSLYLTPKYGFNPRRLNENLNLTRRSNAKPISTELSYSNEENDIKFNLQDAIRHPVDLKSKIQQNSLVFDKVQNGRRQMAPVDRIRLRDESSFSDDEGIIKNNIYKVFNKDN